MISVILPCFNEANNIPEIYDRLITVLNLTQEEYELIFIDDGSTDNTLETLSHICAKDSRVKVLEFSRNFGHQAALCAGLDHAQGDAVIMLDAYLQHPPEVILQLIEKWKEGYEIVNTVRNDPPGASLFKKLSAKGFYKVMNLFTNMHIPENSADFRLIDRKVVTEFKGLKEKNKFFRGLVNWIGFKKCVVTYDASPRLAGVSKYSFWKMLKFAFDGITSFSAFPLHVATMLGILVSCASFLYAMYAIYIRVFTETAVPGWTSVLVAVLFLGGVQLLSLGIIGEYLNRVYTETKDRPVYIVRNVHGSRKQG